MYSEIIKKCSLFSGLSDSELKDALSFFNAAVRSYPRGEFINRISQPLQKFGLVLSGTIQVYMDDIDGHHMIMANINEGETFGESLCFLGKEAPVYICAVTDAVVLTMDTARIKSLKCMNGIDVKMVNRFMALLASRALSMNDRIQILSKKTIRGKLIAFFTQYVTRYGECFTVPFDRSNMAVYLGTERSALSRELARMRDEGIIEFNKNEFKILKKIE